MGVEINHKFNVGSGKNNRELALKKLPGHEPGVVWLGGFRSDMTGTKAQAMVNWAQENGHASLRFDYSGHGASSGDFADGTISRWLEDTTAVIEHHTRGPQILVGSSMGGWITLRLVQEISNSGLDVELAGILLIAPAPDFTKELMEPVFSDQQINELNERGFISELSEYSDEPNIITKELIEDGRNNLVLSGLIETGCPVHILQGMQDPDVPFQHAMRLLDHLPSQNVTMTLIKDGDHRLSREQDIQLMINSLNALVANH